MELNKNSNEMKTEVETFVVEETANLIYDNESLERWNKIVTALDLKGQTSIVKPEKSPIPFMPIKASMLNVFTELCPRRVDVEDYDISPIPLEILELVALSKNENYFNELQIWYDEKDPDPLCIGKTQTYYGYKNGSWNNSDRVDAETKQGVVDIIGSQYSVYDTNEKWYLLGKWADVKHSFEELKQMATKRFISNSKNSIEKRIIDAQRELDDLETMAFNRFN